MMSAKGSRGRRSFDADPKSKWSTRAPIKYRFHESLGGSSLLQPFADAPPAPRTPRQG